jgi:hypothetical protein
VQRMEGGGGDVLSFNIRDNMDARRSSFLFNTCNDSTKSKVMQIQSKWWSNGVADCFSQNLFSASLSEDDDVKTNARTCMSSAIEQFSRSRAFDSVPF